MTKCKLFGLLFLLGSCFPTFSQTTQVQFNTTTPCPIGDRSPCGASDNRVRFYVTTQAPDTVSASNPDILPRFKAFWIPGDGNFLSFDDTDTDVESRNPSQPYNYAKTGDYLVSVYLTGKYTNRHPPPGGVRQINVPVVPPPPASGVNPYAPNRFNESPGNRNFDFFPIHDIRKDYLTPLILSYPATIDSTWGYLFYNGRPNGTAWTERPLVYKKTPGVVAKYYNGDSSRITAYATTNLSGEIAFENLTFDLPFARMQEKFSDVLYFPLETVPAANLPSGFSKKRYFPVFWANKDIEIGAADSLLSFCYIVTGPKPLPPGERERMQIELEKSGLSLPVSTPINVSNGFGTADRLRLQEQAIVVQQSPTKYQYIQGFYTSTVNYVAAHDPNQLTVTKIDPLPNGKYLVSFHLEMCNKGGGHTHKQFIELFDRFGRFGDFKYNGNLVSANPAEANHYLMESELDIQGIPEEGYEMRCESIDFTAVTDCNGIRSLWETNPERAFEVCVRFAEVDETECGSNLPIDSCAFKIGGKCFCEEKETPVPSCGGGDWLLTFILLFVFILLIWKYYADQENNM